MRRERGKKTERKRRGKEKRKKEKTKNERKRQKKEGRFGFRHKKGDDRREWGNLKQESLHTFALLANQKNYLFLNHKTKD